MASIFSRIIAGDIPSYKVAENDYCYAFLDINPLAKGHTLVVPKQEIDYIFDIDDRLLQEMILFSKKVATAIQKTVPCLRIGMSVIGLEVPHVHVHLIPLHTMENARFTHKEKLTPEEFKVIATKIVSNFN